nr:hypothetical protein [Microctonus hyperodae filamentous virus]
MDACNVRKYLLKNPQDVRAFLGSLSLSKLQEIEKLIKMQQKIFQLKLIQHVYGDEVKKIQNETKKMEKRLVYELKTLIARYHYLLLKIHYTHYSKFQQNTRIINLTQANLQQTKIDLLAVLQYLTGIVHQMHTTIEHLSISTNAMKKTKRIMYEYYIYEQLLKGNFLSIPPQRPPPLKQTTLTVTATVADTFRLLKDFLHTNNNQQVLVHLFKTHDEAFNIFLKFFLQIQEMYISSTKNSFSLHQIFLQKHKNAIKNLVSSSTTTTPQILYNIVLMYKLDRLLLWTPLFNYVKNYNNYLPLNTL